MLLKIAWRNVWRNKVRSFVVIAAIAVGLWAGVFASAFVNGMMEQKIENVVHLEISHLQVHHPDFTKEFLPEFTVSDTGTLKKEIAGGVIYQSYSGRVITMAMLGSARKNGGIKIIGVNPGEEMQVTDLHRYIVEGNYLTGEKKSPILISSKTAEEFDVALGSKVVLTFQDINKEITAGAFKVAGVFNTGNPMYDEMNAFVLRRDLQNLLGIGGNIHEMAVILKETDSADAVVERLQKNHPDLEISSWKDLSPGMRFMVEAMGQYTLIIVGIILIALLFSIVNTMLMAVLERVHEIGMLMAIGLTKSRLFFMILLETVFLSLIGGPLGLLLSWISISYFGIHGINLGDAAYGEMGFSNLIYPSLSLTTYIEVTVLVLAMAVIASLYPARKALKLNPMEAIRQN